MTLILSGTDGLSDVDGSAATPAIRGTDANTGIFFPAADTIAFSEGGVEAMRIDSSGNVGIGTASPNASYKMSITGNSASIYSGILFTDTNAGGGVFSIYGESAALKFRDSSAGATRMVIDSSGNVGIGTSSPGSSLHVSKTTTTLSGTGNGYGVHVYPTSSGDTYVDAITGSSGNTTLTFRTYNNGTYNNVRIDSSGNLLVGTTSGSGARMDVVAADEVVSFNRSAATDGVVQRWRKAGSTVGYVSTNTYSLPSDERVKTNIVNIGYGLDFVNSLRPVQYNTIFQDPENETKKNFGLIAQEVEQALANIGKSVDDVTFLEKFVPENDTESRYGLGYQNLVPVLIKAIQEQQAIITQLQADVAALKAQP